MVVNASGQAVSAAWIQCHDELNEDVTFICPLFSNAISARANIWLKKKLEKQPILQHIVTYSCSMVASLEDQKVKGQSPYGISSITKI